MKCTIKKCTDTNLDIHIALLQIRSAPLGADLPSPAMLLFNHPIRGIIPIINRLPFNSNNNYDHCKALVKRQTKNDKYHGTARNYASFALRSTVAVHLEDGRLWTHSTVSGRGDNNHNNRLYMINITESGRLITWKS